MIEVGVQAFGCCEEVFAEQTLEAGVYGRHAGAPRGVREREEVDGMGGQGSRVCGGEGLPYRWVILTDSDRPNQPVNGENETSRGTVITKTSETSVTVYYLSAGKHIFCILARCVGFGGDNVTVACQPTHKGDDHRTHMRQRDDIYQLVP